MDDPDLLAELAAITGEQQPPTTARVAEPATKARVASLKKEALALKKANNIGAAKAKLAEAKRLEAQMAQLAATPPPAPRGSCGARLWLPWGARGGRPAVRGVLKAQITPWILMRWSSRNC